MFKEDHSGFRIWMPALFISSLNSNLTIIYLKHKADLISKWNKLLQERPGSPGFPQLSLNNLKAFLNMRLSACTNNTCSHFTSPTTLSPFLQCEAVDNTFMMILAENLLIWLVEFLPSMSDIAIPDLTKYSQIRWRNWCIFHQFTCTSTTGSTLRSFARV